VGEIETFDFIALDTNRKEGRRLINNYKRIFIN
jgi:hypothetical protein